MSKRKIKVEFHLDTNLDSNKLKKVVSFDYGTADCKIEAALYDWLDQIIENMDYDYEYLD